MSISQQQQHPPLHGADFGAGSSLPPPTIEAGPSRRPVRDGLNDVGMSGPPFRSQPQQRHPSVHGTDFGARSSLPPPTVEAGPSRRPIRDGLGLNDVGRSGPPFRARRRVAFTRHVSRIPRASASPPPPASLGFNHGSTRGASRVGPGMGHRGSVSVPNHHRHEGPVAVKFRLHRRANFGISVKQALDRERLSQTNNYLLQDIAPNMSRTIKLKVGSGHDMSLYTIPLSSNHHGHVDQQTLARRTARALVHYMQRIGFNNVPWDHVMIHRLEEIEPGIWIPIWRTH